MGERYPYIHFVIDAGQLIAAVLALCVFLGGWLSSCHRGGFGGLLAFLLTVAVATLVYIGVMVQIELLRLLLDIEESTRQGALERRDRPTAPPTE